MAARRRIVSSVPSHLPAIAPRKAGVTVRRSHGRALPVPCLHGNLQQALGDPGCCYFSGHAFAHLLWPCNIAILHHDIRCNLSAQDGHGRITKLPEMGPEGHAREDITYRNEAQQVALKLHHRLYMIRLCLLKRH